MQPALRRARRGAAAPADLEREKEVSPRCAADALERAPRERRTEVGAQQELELAGVEVAERQSAEAHSGEGSVELERYVGARAPADAEEAEALIREAPRHEGESTLRRGVEPLRVVD